MEAIEAQFQMTRAYAEKINLEYKLDELAKAAFPVGMECLCTQWRFPAIVTILAVYGDRNIHVRSHTGREYSTRATQLGVSYGTALEIAKSAREEA